MTTTRSAIVAAAFAVLSAMPVVASAQGVEPESGREDRNRAARAARVAGANCVLSKVGFRTETTQVSTTSTGFGNIPDTFVTFTQSAAGCVIVRYTAETHSPSNTGIDVRARLDGAINGSPGAVFWTTDHDEDNDGRGFRVYAFDFVFPNVAAGSHTVQMQWRTIISGVPGWMFFRTLTVQHR